MNWRREIIFIVWQLWLIMLMVVNHHYVWNCFWKMVWKPCKKQYWKKVLKKRYWKKNWKWCNGASWINCANSQQSVVQTKIWFCVRDQLHFLVFVAICDYRLTFPEVLWDESNNRIVRMAERNGVNFHALKKFSHARPTPHATRHGHWATQRKLPRTMDPH